MQLLITGGSGFIGQRLCHFLTSRGHQLTVLSRHLGAVPKICGQHVRGIASLQSIATNETIDAIINLAGEPIAARRWTPHRKQFLRDSRIGVTEQIVTLIDRLETRPHTLISASATGFYGDRGDVKLDESSSFADDFGHRLCNEWEQAATRASESGVRVCILRIGPVIGSKGGFIAPMLLPFKLGLGGRIGDGRQWMSWIHMDDLVAALNHLLSSDELHGAFNGTAPNPVRNRDFTQTLAALLNRPTLFPIPAILLKTLLGEMSGLLLGGQRALPERLLQSKFAFRYPHLKPALSDALNDQYSR